MSFDADRLLGIYLRMLDRLPDRRVEIFFSAPELEEECLMVDPGTEKGDFVLMDVDPFRDHLARPLHTVAESNVGAKGRGVDGPTVCCHRVDVIQEQGVRREIVQFKTKIDEEPGSSGALEIHRLGRAYRRHTVPLRYFCGISMSSF